MKQNKFEQLIRLSLTSRAAGVEPTADMWENIKTAISETEKKNSVSLFVRKLSGNLLYCQPTWKKAMAVTVGGVLLVGSLAFGTSAQARACVEEKIQIITGYKIVRSEGGYVVVKENQTASRDGTKISNLTPKPAKSMDNNMTTAEAEAAAGFTLSLPSYLPDGYQQVAISAGKWDNGKGFVQVLYQTAGRKPDLDLMITSEQGFLQGGDAIQEVKVGDKTDYWCEYLITSINGKGSEPTVKAGHLLKWEAAGIVYILRDRGVLTLDEMKKTSASIK